MKRETGLDLLQSGPRGVQEWNRVRQDGESIPDLSSANLSRRDLMDADLHGVCLQWACFGGSDLDRSDLSGADLRHADMAVCCLCGADLRRADLRQANLRCSRVACADLTDADLSGANLSAVDLSMAVLRVADPKDVRASMGRVDRLPLGTEGKHCLLEIIQKLDILDELTEGIRQEAAACVDGLAKELLKSPRNFSNIKSLLEIISKIAPPLVTDVSEDVFWERHPCSGVC